MTTADSLVKVTLVTLVATASGETGGHALVLAELGHPSASRALQLGLLFQQARLSARPRVARGLMRPAAQNCMSTSSCRWSMPSPPSARGWPSYPPTTEP